MNKEGSASRKKEANLRAELHHRFKNNLQLLVSLCGLQADRTSNPEVLRVLRNMQNRIRVIAHIHERLQDVKGHSLIDAGDYLKQLVDELQSSFDEDRWVTLQLSLADMALETEQALALGLLSNELLSNAFEHAFVRDRQGAISVALRYSATAIKEGEPELAELEIKDDGIGLPDEANFWKDESMGFHLVRILGAQLRAAIHVESGKGTLFRIRFPLSEAAA